MRIKQRVHEVLEPPRPGDRTARSVGVLLLALIALNVAALVLETVEAVHSRAPRLFAALEAVSVAVFSLEYVLRLWSTTASEEFRHPFFGRLRFALTPLALCDLLSILPFYLPFAGVDLRFVRAVRLLRFFRLAKLGRYSLALQTFGLVLRRKKEELVTMLLLLLLLLVFSSSAMYFVENPSQPEAFSSIPQAMWWGIATLTTVGYGDIYPVTGLGRVLGSIIAILGIGVFALPAGVLGAAFVEELQRRKRPEACPHCGKPLSGARAGDPGASQADAPGP
jgi:voltage-gated potassium channel